MGLNTFVLVARNEKVEADLKKMLQTKTRLVAENLEKSIHFRKNNNQT
jgi:hypothetical protein